MAQTARHRLARPLPSSVYRRRRLTALGGFVVVLGGLAFVAVTLLGGGGGDAAGGGTAAARATKALPPPTLPTGTRRLFPDYRVVAFYGSPLSDELGALGIGDPRQASRRLVRQAEPYTRKTRPVLPALELIATLATAAPGPNGKHRQRLPDSVIRRYLKAARAAKALLVLDVQPGREDFFTEVTRLKKWLREPDVGLALDPEWRVGPNETPGQVIGSVSSREVNAVTAWLQRLTARGRLPEKLLVIHQFTPDMIRGRERLRSRPGLATVLNADGFGTPPQKLAKYRQFTALPPRYHDGFKLFYREDTDLMSPRAVMRLKPRPDFVVYE